MAAFTFFNPFRQKLGLSVFQFHTDTLQIALFTNAVAPTTSDATYADNAGFTLNSSLCTEVATGGGYTANGQVLGATDFTVSGGTATLACTSSAITWTSSGGGFSFRYVVCYDITAGTLGARPLIGWWDYGSNLTLVAPQTFSVILPSNVFTLS